MRQSEAELAAFDRHQEFLALLNMCGYARGIAEQLGATAATSHIDAAREALLADFSEEFGGEFTMDKLPRLAPNRAGHC